MGSPENEDINVSEEGSDVAVEEQTNEEKPEEEEAPHAITEEESTVREPKQLGVLYFHSKLETVLVLKYHTNHLGEQKAIEKFTQLHHKRCTFAGVCLPTNEVELVDISIGASSPNTSMSDCYRKRTGRNIAKGRAIKVPMFILEGVARGEANKKFIEACNKLYPFVGEFYMNEDKRTNLVINRRFAIEAGKYEDKKIPIIHTPEILQFMFKQII